MKISNFKIIDNECDIGNNRAVLIRHFLKKIKNLIRQCFFIHLNGDNYKFASESNINPQEYEKKDCFNHGNGCHDDDGV